MAEPTIPLSPAGLTLSPSCEKNVKGTREKIDVWDRRAKASLDAGNIIDMDEQHRAMRDELMWAWRQGRLIPSDEVFSRWP